VLKLKIAMLRLGATHAVEVFGITLVGVNADNGWKLLAPFAFLLIVLLLRERRDHREDPEDESEQRPRHRSGGGAIPRRRAIPAAARDVLDDTQVARDDRHVAYGDVPFREELDRAARVVIRRERGHDCATA
jgi:hypothetical protein